MLNWTAVYVGIYLFGLGGPLQSDDPRSSSIPVSNDVLESARLPVFWGDPELQGLHIGIFIALAATRPLLGPAQPLGHRLRGPRGRLQPRRGRVRRHQRGAQLRQGHGDLRRVRRPGRRDRRARLAVPHRDERHPDLRRSASSASRSRCSAATPRSARSLAALLFGALLNGTSVRNLDPTIFEPQLATNLTYIIQGLIVLFVSAPVLVTLLSRGRFRCAAEADAQARGHERRMSATSDAPAAPPSPAGGRPGSRLRARLARVSREAWMGWAGVALGVIAFYITLPPILVRSLVPSLLIAAVGLVLGVVAIRAGEKRVGWGAVVACVAGALGAYGAVESGVDQPRARRRLVGAARRRAALRDAAHVRRARRRDVRALGRRQHRPRGHDADRRVLRRLGRRRHRQLGRRDPDRPRRRRRDRPAARGLRGHRCAPTRSSPAPRSTSSRSASPASCT